MSYDQKQYYNRPTKKVILTGVIFAVLSAILVMSKIEPLVQLDRISYDFMLRGLGEAEPHPDILIVDIGEDSLSRYGQWPWPRDLIAKLLDTVRDGEPQFVGVDILFPEPDRTSLGNLFDGLYRKFGAIIEKDLFPLELIDHDWALARTLERGTFHLGTSFRFGSQEKGRGEMPGSLLTVKDSPGFFPEESPFLVAGDVVAPISLLAEAADGVGFINVLGDSDGIIRRTPLLINYKGNYYPSLGLAAFLSGKESKDVTVHKVPNGDNVLSVGRVKIPVDMFGNMVVRFKGPSQTYPYISAEMILNGDLAPDIFRDKIVFVGSTAEGLQDTHITAFDRNFSGVEVHATVAGALLSQDFIVKPGWSVVLQGVGLFFIILIALMAELRLSAWSAGAIFLGLLAVLPLLAFLLFSTTQIFISPTSSLALFVVSFALLALIRFRSEEIRTMHYERQLAAAQEMAIVGLASIVETRDNETGKHILRTQKYVQLLARYLSKNNPAKYYFQPQDIELLYKSSALHDVGKVGVPDTILLKKGPLTDDEFDEMKMHTVYGAHALGKADEVAREADEPPFLEMAKEIALTHHERWDGTGYPNGLKGEEIPVTGRLMALADVYDALVSKRVYKDAMTHKDASRYIMSGRSRHFDPQVIDAFEVLLDDFYDIAERYKDARS